MGLGPDGVALPYARQTGTWCRPLTLVGLGFCSVAGEQWLNAGLSALTLQGCLSALTLHLCWLKARSWSLDFPPASKGTASHAGWRAAEGPAGEMNRAFPLLSSSL